MIKNSLKLVPSMALLTALALAGSLMLGFAFLNLYLDSVNMHVGVLGGSLAALFAYIVFPALGGAVWGYGLGRLFDADRKALAIKGARIWGLSVILAVIVLLLFNLLLDVYYLHAQNAIPVYIPFMLSFAAAAGLVAGSSAGRMAGHLGLDDLKGRVGRSSGVAAGLTFLAVVLLMHANGWQVGGAHPGKQYVMTTVVLAGGLGAALAGGATMGWTLVRAGVQERNDFSSSPETAA